MSLGKTFRTTTSVATIDRINASKTKRASITRVESAPAYSRNAVASIFAIVTRADVGRAVRARVAMTFCGWMV